MRIINSMWVLKKCVQITEFASDLPINDGEDESSNLDTDIILRVNQNK